MEAEAGLLKAARSTTSEHKAHRLNLAAHNGEKSINSYI